MCDCENILRVRSNSGSEHWTLQFKFPDEGCPVEEWDCSGSLGVTGGIIKETKNLIMTLEICVDCGKIQNLDLDKLKTQLRERRRELEEEEESRYLYRESPFDSDSDSEEEQD